MRISKSQVFLLSVIFVFVGCKRSEEQGYTPVINHEFKEGGILNDWKCHKVVLEEICIPNSWNKLTRNDVFFASSIADPIENTYFVVNKYDVDSVPVSLENHLSDIKRALLLDTVQSIKEYQLTEIVFDKRSALYGEFILQIVDSVYVYFTMMWIQDGSLYDLGLKVPFSEKEKYYKVFQVILYNYRIAGTPAFSSKDELVKIKQLNLEDF